MKPRLLTVALLLLCWLFFSRPNAHGSRSDGHFPSDNFNGNRATRTTGGQTDSYGYDVENRLVSLTKTTAGGTGAYSYVYDYRTRRINRTENGLTTNLVFSGGTSVQEYTAGALAVDYVRGSDWGGGVGGVLYSMRAGTPSFAHYNRRGDVTTRTDGAGVITYQASYEAGGKRTAEFGSTPDRQRANTKEEDPTGLLDEGFRYRDLETLTFITRDPAGFVDGPNLYAYVRQNPWSAFDPLGLDEESVSSRFMNRIGQNALGLASAVSPVGGSPIHITSIGTDTAKSQPSFSDTLQGQASALGVSTIRAEVIVNPQGGRTFRDAWNNVASPEGIADLTFDGAVLFGVVGAANSVTAFRSGLAVEAGAVEGSAARTLVQNEAAVAGKTPAQRLADKAQGLRAEIRPNTVAVIKHPNGTITVGRNQGGVTHPDVDAAVAGVPPNEYGAQCAEINALARASAKGRPLGGAEISVSKVRGPNSTTDKHGTSEPPCSVCAPVVDSFGVKVKN